MKAGLFIGESQENQNQRPVIAKFKSRRTQEGLGKISPQTTFKFKKRLTFPVKETKNIILLLHCCFTHKVWKSKQNYESYKESRK